MEINKEVLTPIHRFNNGNGATLCNDCNTVINVGFSNYLYCRQCYMQRDPKIQKAVNILKETINENTNS